MRGWPSIIPAASEDYYIVVNHYGRFGTAFAETDLDRANYETTIADLMSGQHCDPLRVIMFNPATNRSEDVSHAIAQEILRRLGLEGRSVPPLLEDFMDRHVGQDRQLTLRRGCKRSHRPPPDFSNEQHTRRGVRGGHNVVWDGHKCTPGGDIHERIATLNIEDLIWIFG